MIHKNGEKEEPLDLHSLNRVVEPPAELEDRVVSELRSRGLLSPRSRKVSNSRVFGTIAACLVFFVGGMMSQKYRGADDAALVPTMSDSTYVLFLMEGSDFIQTNDDKQLQERIDTYRRWALDLRNQGIPIRGTKLRDEKNLLGKAQIADRNEEISGYFLIDAQNSDEAIAIARKCPHLQYGGTIEIRRVHPVKAA